MSDRDDVERRLEAWLAETARPMPPGLVDDIVTTTTRVPRPGVRAQFPSGRRWRIAIAAAAAAAVIAVGIGIGLRVPLGPGASGSPAASSPPASGTPAASSPLVSPSPTSAASLGEWHRNNYNAGEERLSCREGAESWTCTYAVPDGTGFFSGQNVTASWTCPGWFPSTICNNVIAVYGGRTVYPAPEGQTPGPANTPMRQEYVITRVDGQQVLQLYWVDQFVCPWYRTFDQALRAEFVCFFAP